jgi:hypothetical protein
VVDVSRRFRFGRGTLAAALRLLAVYAGVRAALRAGALHNEKARSGLEANEGLAKPAARIAPEERAPAAETPSTSVVSTSGSSPSVGGGHRSHRGVAGRTYRQLYEEARRRGVPGRSGMSKASLEAALSRASSSASRGRSR